MKDCTNGLLCHRSGVDCSPRGALFAAFSELSAVRGWLLLLPVFFAMLGGCGRIGVEALSSDSGFPFGDDGAPRDAGRPTDTGAILLTDEAFDTEILTDGEIFTDSDTGSQTVVDPDTGVSTGSEEDGPTDTLGPTDTDIATEDLSDAGDPSDTGTSTDSTECDVTHAGALGCNGFENGIEWLVDTRDGALEIVTDPVYDGASALHAQTEADNNFAIATAEFPALTMGTIYFRSYYLIPTQTFTGLFKVASLRGGEPTPADEDEPNLDINITETLALGIHLHEEPDETDHYLSDPGVVPLDAWFCLRGAVEISDMGSVTLFIDDTQRIQVTGLDTLTPSGISLADVGIGWTEDATGPLELYADNFVVDTAPIPCD